MKKFIVFIFLSTQLLSGQEKELFARYNFSLNGSNDGVQEIELIADGKAILNKIKGISKGSKVVGGQRVDVTRPFEYFIFQDLVHSEIIAEEQVNGPNKIIRDSLPTFNWTLTGKSKTILNYQCTEATATYKGRAYYAYFTMEIPFKVAPWKFNGLPGFTVMVRSKYDFLRIELKELKIRPIIKPIINPIPLKEAITWNTYETWYLNYVEKLESKIALEYAAFPNFKSNLFIQNVEIISALNLTEDLKKEKLNQKAK